MTEVCIIKTWQADRELNKLCVTSESHLGVGRYSQKILGHVFLTFKEKGKDPSASTIHLVSDAFVPASHSLHPHVLWL